MKIGRYAVVFPLGMVILLLAAWTLPVGGQALNSGGAAGSASPLPEARKAYFPLVKMDKTDPAPLLNGNFEQGHTAWTEYSSHGWPIILNSGFPGSVNPHGGEWAAWLGGDDSETSFLEQTVNITETNHHLNFFHWAASAETSCGWDVWWVLIGGNVVAQNLLCVSNNTDSWVSQSLDLQAYIGQSVVLQFRVETDGSLNSSYFLDDISLDGQPSMPPARGASLEKLDGSEALRR